MSLPTSNLLLRTLARPVSRSLPLINASRSFTSGNFLRNAFRPQQIKAERPSVLKSLGFKRFQSQYAGFQPTSPYSSSQFWTRVLSTAGVVAVGTVGINFFLNRETRDALDPFERSYLNQTFAYVGSGLAIVGTIAVLAHKNGVSHRIMRANPWLVMGVSLVGGIGSMLGVFYTKPESVVLKHACWVGFQAFQAMTLSPLLFLSPALLARAGLYTLGMMSSLAYVGATARSDQYLYMGGPLLAGLVVVALSSLAPMLLPVTAMRTLAFSEAISLYGGLAVFGGFTLYDTQKMLNNARLAKQGRVPADPVRESISFELDFINIFIRMVTILSNSQRRR